MLLRDGGSATECDVGFHSPRRVPRWRSTLTSPCVTLQSGSGVAKGLTRLETLEVFLIYGGLGALASFSFQIDRPFRMGNGTLEIAHFCKSGRERIEVARVRSGIVLYDLEREFHRSLTVPLIGVQGSR